MMNGHTEYYCLMYNFAHRHDRKPCNVPGYANWGALHRHYAKQAIRNLRFAWNRPSKRCRLYNIEEMAAQRREAVPGWTVEEILAREG